MNKKIVLFFDINSTILADDKSSLLTLEDALNIHLASTVWTKPDEKPPRFNLRLFGGPTGSKGSDGNDDDVISGYKYYKREMPADHKQYLKSFSATKEGSEYAYFHNLLLQTLHDRPPMSIFDSFFATLAWLRDVAAPEGYAWCVCLRTYGDDLPFLLQKVRDFAQGSFPVADTYAALSLSETGVSLKVNSNSDGAGTTLTSEQDVVEWLYSREGVIGVKDDYFYWRDHAFATEFGKPIWVPHSQRTLYIPIFFDDNYRFGSDNSILDVRVQQQQHEGGPFVSVFRDGAFVEPRERSMAVTERVCVKARMFEAISNRNFFIDCLKLRIKALNSDNNNNNINDKTLFIRTPNERELNVALAKAFGDDPSAAERHRALLKSQFAYRTELVDWIVSDTPWEHSSCGSAVLGFCQAFRCVLHAKGSGSTRHAYCVRNVRSFADFVPCDLVVKLLAERIAAVDPFADMLFCESSDGFGAKTLSPAASVSPSVSWDDFTKIGKANFGNELYRAATSAAIGDCSEWDDAEEAEKEENGVCYKRSSWAFWTLVEDYIWVFLLIGEKEYFAVLEEMAQAYATRCGVSKVIITDNATTNLSIYKVNQ